MSAIYSGAFWNSAQLPETNAVTRRRSRNDNSCNRCHLDGSSNEKRGQPHFGANLRFKQLS